MIAARRRWGLALAAVVIAGSTVLALPAVRTPILQAIGHSLVVDDGLESADTIVIAVDAYIEGVLEAADLVQAGRANQVAVFADPPDVIDREFLRRGVPYEDAAARAVRQLKSLGVQTVERIPRAVAGTEDLAMLLPVWCDEQGIDSLIVVTDPGSLATSPAGVESLPGGPQHPRLGPLRADFPLRPGQLVAHAIRGSHGHRGASEAALGLR